MIAGWRMGGILAALLLCSCEQRRPDPLNLVEISDPSENIDAAENSAAEEANHIIEVNAGELASAYFSNASAADHRYEGHYLLIVGRITRMRPAVGGIELFLKRPAKSLGVWATVSTLASGSAYGERDAKVGDLVTIGCAEINRAEDPIAVNDCANLSILDED